MCQVFRFSLLGRSVVAGAIPLWRCTPRLSSVGPCQAAAWLPVCWHARDCHCLGPDPLWRGRGGGVGRLGATVHQFCLVDSAPVLPGLRLGNPLYSLTPMWTKNMPRSYHLISQAAWNRCNLLYSSLVAARHCLICSALWDDDIHRCFPGVFPCWIRSACEAGSRPADGLTASLWCQGKA